MFITVTCSEEKCFITKNESQKLEVCRREYFHIRITASASQQIARLSRTFNLNFQDFPGPKSFSRISRSWKFYKKIPGLPGGVEAPGTMVWISGTCTCIYDQQAIFIYANLVHVSSLRLHHTRRHTTVFKEVFITKRPDMNSVA